MSETKTVHRFEVSILEPTTLTVPRGRVLAVDAMRWDRLELWIETGRPEVTKTLAVFGTGHPIPVSAQWLGTAPRTGDGLVWHLYDISAGGPQVGLGATGHDEED